MAQGEFLKADEKGADTIIFKKAELIEKHIYFLGSYCVSQSPHKKNCYIIESRQKELLHNEKKMRNPKPLQRYTTIFPNPPYVKNCYIIESRQKELLHNEKNAQPETAPEVHNDIPKSTFCLLETNAC